MIRVLVSGALGRMGRLALQTVNTAGDLEYAGGFARVAVPEERIDNDLARLLQTSRPDVVLDFTTRPATQQVARAAVDFGIPPIIGSSEWDEREQRVLREQCERRGVGALIVPNFAIGAVLMMRFAQEAARFFPSAEIIELHHAGKRDAPSGTAAATARRITRGGGRGDVPIHSVRLTGLLSHQEVLFGNTGELLTIRHDSFSVESFAAGMLLAIRNLAGMRGLQIGLESLLNARSANGA